MTIIIGAQKKAQELPLFCSEEIKQLIDGAERLIEQSIPLEVPASIRVGDLVRIASTMKKYQGLLTRFVESYDEKETGCGDWTDLYKEAYEDAKEVLNIKPPPLIQPSPLLEV